MTEIDMFLGGPRALGKRGFETLDRNERSVGIFPTRREAANAISGDGEKTCS